MAQLDDRRVCDGLKCTLGSQNSPASEHKTPKAQTPPTFEQLLQSDSAVWPSIPSPTYKKHNDYEGNDHSPNRKSSVFSRVREKAKKLRHNLSNKKRQSQDNDSPNANNATSWGSNLGEDEDEVDEDPEYHGAPMYESELAPESYKETARQHPREVPVPSEKHVVENSIRNEVKKEENASPSEKTITETMSEKLAPAYAAMTNATHTITSKFAGLTVETSASTQNIENSTDSTVISPQKKGIQEHKTSSERKANGRPNYSPHTWDKGISVKEYLINKFEPGEDERALSQVITDAMSPRTSPTGNQIGMMGKMKEAVSSFLRTEESSSVSPAKTESMSENILNHRSPKSSSNNSIPSTKRTFSDSNAISSTAKTNPSPDNLSITTNSKSLPRIGNTISATTNTASPKSSTHTKLSSFIPISSNPREVADAENHGRILQAN